MKPDPMTPPTTAQGYEIAEMRRERDEARQIVRDIYWMALRYADGRQTYAPGMCNDALRKAYDAGWLTHRHATDPAYARDGASPEYRGLSARALLAESQVAEAKGALRDARDTMHRYSDQIQHSTVSPSVIAGGLLHGADRARTALANLEKETDARALSNADHERKE